MITLRQLDLLIQGRLGVYNTACPICDPTARWRPLRVWSSPCLIFWYCGRCAELDWLRPCRPRGELDDSEAALMIYVIAKARRHAAAKAARP